MVIADFNSFREELTNIFNSLKDNHEGTIANYIPELQSQDPESFGVAVCTIDGKRFSLGDAHASFCLQSVCKPINYCLALEEHGDATTHSFVGHEPSGHGFNELKLNQDGIPHNPMINSGAIVCCGLIQSSLSTSARFQYVLDAWEKVTGGTRPSFDNAVYLSEKESGDRNYALGYFMREMGALPHGVDLIKTLEFYFQCCSIGLSCDSLAVAAATLANGGCCPLTQNNVFAPHTVKNCLTLMSSCGMYDYSGEFAFRIGVPAKSGVSGGIMAVVPNVLGLAIWSPRLDRTGNSVRGVRFCQELVKRYNFHAYDSLRHCPEKVDPRLPRTLDPSTL